MLRFVLSASSDTHVLSPRRLFSALLSLAVCCCPMIALAQASPWLRPQHAGDPLLWGRRDGIIFGLPSKDGLKGPRGLIRIGVMTPGSDQPLLLNYVAVEPVVRGPGNRFDRMAFSELEMSQLDPGEQGKRLSVHAEMEPVLVSSAGSLETFKRREGMVERLSVRIDVETFSANGAHVFLIASVDSDRPQELRLATFAEKDSPVLEELTLTATMGNYERLRLLWLKDSVQNSLRLFPGYAEDDFAEGDSYPLAQMNRSAEGDAIVYATSDERSPRDTAGNANAHWPYLLSKLTQYWRVPGHDVQPDLRVRVNARRVYWASHAPVLGGIAFENFEVRQRFVPGQEFIFGISRKEPGELDAHLAHLQSRLASQPGHRKDPAQ